MFRSVALFTALAVLAATPAAAQSSSGGSVAEVANDLPYSHCPAFLERGRPLSLTDELKRRGFFGQPEPLDDPFFPGFEWFVQSFDDGKISVSGLPGRVCVIKVNSNKAGTVADAWQAQVEKRFPTFTFDKERSGEVFGIQMFTWNTPAGASRRMSLAVAFQSLHEFDENGGVAGSTDQATFQLIFED